MKKIVSGLALAPLSITAMLMAEPVMATTYTGSVQTLRFNAGTSAARVSIYVGQPTACGAWWYAFENADSGKGKLWTAALLAAKAQGKTVSISGTGVCDAWNIEGVSYIDVQWHTRHGAPRERR